jgi:hypothetical protein
MRPKALQMSPLVAPIADRPGNGNGITVADTDGNPVRFLQLPAPGAARQRKCPFAQRAISLSIVKTATNQPELGHAGN